MSTRTVALKGCSDLKAFVISIRGLPLSETGARKCIESAAGFGVGVELFPAINRYEAVPTMLRLGLDINRRHFDRISDQPIGDRAQVPLGQRWLTSPELGCFLSHFQLWQKCIELGENVLVFEHDVVLIAPLPEIPAQALAMNLYPFHYPGTVAYVITPRAARMAVREARRRGVQPSDEVLWRAALLRQKVVTWEPAVVKLEDHGVSTIQFTRTDDHHNETRSTNPWLEFTGADSAKD